MRRRHQLLTRCLAATAAAATCAAIAGCYSHVVKARGPNAESYDIHEPNNPDQKARPAENRTYTVPGATSRNLQ